MKRLRVLLIALAPLGLSLCATPSFAQNAGGAAAPQVSFYRNDAAHSGYTAAAMPTPLSLVWRHTTTYVKDNAASPVYADGVLYFGSGPTLYAISAADGTQLWKFPATDAATGNFGRTPALVGGYLYVGNDNGQVYKIDAKTGTKVWAMKAGGAVRSSPVVDGGLVFFGSADQNCYAISADTGKTVWTVTTNGSITASPVVVNGQALFASSDDSLYSINEGTGKQEWSVRMPSDPTASPPISVNDNFYVGSGSTLYALRARGTERWHTDLDSAISTPPTSGGDMVYVATQERKVYGISETGRVRWTKSIDYPSYASPLLAGNVLLVPTEHGILYALDAATGDTKWQYVVQATGTADQPKYQSTNIASAPIWVGGTLYVLSDDGTLSAFRPDAVDRVPPQVRDLSPAPGSTIAGVQIPYGATVYDDGSGVNPATVVMQVDSAPISLAKYDASKNGVALDLSKDLRGDANLPLTDGLHQITLTAKDWRGNAVTRSWAFVVDNTLNPDGTPAPSAAEEPVGAPQVANAGPPAITPGGGGTMPTIPRNPNGGRDPDGGLNGGPPPPPPLGPPTVTAGTPTPPASPTPTPPAPIPTPPVSPTPAPPGAPAPPTPPV